MNARERFTATMTFKKPDRIPFTPGGGRESTLKAWHSQGLPEDVSDYHAYIRQLIGMAPEEIGDEPRPNLFADTRMIPTFEEKVIERRERSLVVQDWKGNICEISDEFDVTYLRNAIDFVTRKWIKCPVESREDWRDMKRRYDADDPARFPEDFADNARKAAGRTYVGVISFSGPFWQLREWLGFEGLCMMFLDNPDFVHEMVDFWSDFVAEILERTFEHYVPDHMIVNEDMAYKEKPMIGPDMCREFLAPCWRKWTDLARSAGVPVLDVDSDGHAGELIPVWIEAGFNANSPQEVAAGNDLPAYRRTFGTKMAYRGGVDKRAMAKGGDVIKQEIDRVRPVIDAGGYIPGCDHGVPADVSWPDFVDYCRLLAEATGWL